MPITSALRPPSTCRGFSSFMASSLVRPALRAARCVCRAIMSSSLVGMTQAETRLAGVLMRVACRAFAAAIERRRRASRVAAHALAQRSAVLADAGGEHDRVEAAERRGQRAQSRGRCDTRTDRSPPSRTGSSLASSVRMSLEMPETPSKPGLLVDQLLDRAGVHVQLVHQVEHDARIEVAAARAHRQSVGGGEAHRARDAATARHRAHAGAVAEVQHDGLARRPRAHRARAAPARCTRRTGRGSRSEARHAR